MKVNFSYISKIENERLDFGDYPSEKLIRKLAKALDADDDELLILAEKIPEAIRKRVIQRPDVFRRLARPGRRGPRQDPRRPRGRKIVTGHRPKTIPENMRLHGRKLDTRLFESA